MKVRGEFRRNFCCQRKKINVLVVLSLINIDGRQGWFGAKMGCRVTLDVEVREIGRAHV